MPRSRAPRIVLAATVAVSCIAASLTATAGIVISGTRVVYPAEQREVTISIRNPGETPSLVQAWLDDGQTESQPGDASVPFVLTPPLFRLDPTNSQSLRMVFTQEELPTDRETLYWLNVLDIPPRAATNPELPNQLEMAFKHRMKVFFRPEGLPGSAADAPARMTWQLVTEEGKLARIEMNNPSPYHISLAQVSVTAGETSVKSEQPDMLGPFSTGSVELSEQVAITADSAEIEYWFINDYGGNETGVATVSVP